MKVSVVIIAQTCRCTVRPLFRRCQLRGNSSSGDLVIGTAKLGKRLKDALQLTCGLHPEWVTQSGIRDIQRPDGWRIWAGALMISLETRQLWKFEIIFQYLSVYYFYFILQLLTTSELRPLMHSALLVLVLWEKRRTFQVSLLRMTLLWILQKNAKFVIQHWSYFRRSR